MIFSPEENSSQNHACTLKTILAIEQFISENSGQFSKTELWKGLPKKIMYQSYKVVLEYLLHSKKIEINKRKVVWLGGKIQFNLNDFTAQNHNATLNTLCSIEAFATTNSGLYSKTELWENLPKKIMYQTYKVILAYLESSGKIRIKSRKIIGGENK